MAGVMTVERGHRLGEHAHRENQHHLWILRGRATVLDQEVGPGAYVHVPTGVTHDVDATATEGCTIFYLYVRAR
jgi:quercetin dioxygenase-like cupin family protein